jgi:prevent-host-death family protein
MVRIINIYEAKTHFSKLIARVMGGEEIIIGKSGKPIARLVPFSEKPVNRKPGTAAKAIFVSPDFDAPLPNEVQEEFEK